MKKLIIALAAITVGVVANAASVTWMALQITKAVNDSSYSPDFTKYTAYVIDNAAYAYDAADWSYASAIENATHSIALKSSGSVGCVFNDTFTDSHMDGDSVTYYLVIMSEEIDDKTYYIKSATKAGTVSNGKVGMISWAMASAEWNEVPAASIPEPTSGLLMLIGMGAMALRRKRA